MNVQLFHQLTEMNAIRNLRSNTNTSNPLTSFDTLFNQFLTTEMDSISLPPNSSFGRNMDLFLHPAIQLERSQGLHMNVTVPLTNPANTKASNFLPYINAAAERFNIDPNLIYSVIKHESNFNPNAQSRAGASGLMQLMPSTAKYLNVKNIFDPEENIMGGTKYLREMLDKYDGNIQLALAAYNAGPGNVDKYGGIPPFRETQNYVPKVLQTYRSI